MILTHPGRATQRAPRDYRAEVELVLRDSCAAGFHIMLGEKAAIEKIRAQAVTLPPLQLELVSQEIRQPTDPTLDWIVDLTWRDARTRFAVEYKRVATPKNLHAAIDHLNASRNALETLDPNGPLLPMVIVPFLAKEDLDLLLESNVSGIDLCRNGIVIVPGKWFVYRTGEPNLYPSSAAIKRIYRGKSSLVGRILLVEPRFSRVTDLKAAIESRGATIALGTVSKVLNGLEQDLLVSREERVTLLQPELLLERLATNYAPPLDLERISGRLPEGPQPLQTGSDIADDSGIKIAVSGEGRHGQMPTDRLPPIYVESFEPIAERTGFQWTERFANTEFRVTRDPLVYFDRRRQEGIYWTSPLQTYLDLASGGKREQEIARELRSKLLEGDLD